MESVMARYLHACSNCIDIGGRYGSVLARMLHHAPHGRHVAFEAVPSKLAFLRRKFPEVDIHGKALGSVQGCAQFFVDKEKSGFSGLTRSLEGECESIDVDVVRLDDVAFGFSKVDYVKIDVEGGEYDVFQGGEEKFKGHRPLVLFECAPMGLTRFGKTPEQLHELLTEELGYDVFTLRGWLHAETPVTAAFMAEALVFPFKAFNWVAAPRNRD